MKLKIAIYGFGRLGRAVFTVASHRRDIDVVAVYAEQSLAEAVNQLQQDPVYAAVERDITVDDDALVVNGHETFFVPKAGPRIWEDHNVDIVIDCLSLRASNAVAKRHLLAGAKRVVFAGEGAVDETVILGYNEDALKGDYMAISCGGAIANATKPVIDILHKAFGVESSMVVTVSGGGACSSSGCECGDSCKCDKDCGCQQSELPDVLAAPIQTASLSIITALVTKKPTVTKVNDALMQAAKTTYYQGIVAVADDELPGDAVIGESVSALIEAAETDVVDKLVNVNIWSDHEWGYANRIVEVTADYGKAIR